LVGGLGAVGWADRTYETSCGQAELRDGGWFEPPAEGYAIDSFTVSYGHVADDDDQDAVVSIGCAEGGNRVLHDTFVFTWKADGVAQVGQTIEERLLDLLHGLRTTVPIYEPLDARCCPSAREVHTWTISEATWQITDSQREPPERHDLPSEFVARVVDIDESAQTVEWVLTCGPRDGDRGRTSVAGAIFEYETNPADAAAGHVNRVAFEEWAAGWAFRSPTPWVVRSEGGLVVHVIDSSAPTDHDPCSDPRS
jgi:hypothetical protein